jgi:hypothetical protein
MKQDKTNNIELLKNNIIKNLDLAKNKVAMFKSSDVLFVLKA